VNARPPIGEAFDKAAVRWGDRTACLDRVLGLWHATSWRDHAKAVHTLAARLAEVGIGPGAIVGIAGPNGGARLAAERAVLHRGAMVRPLADPDEFGAADAPEAQHVDAVLAPDAGILATLSRQLRIAPSHGFVWDTSPAGRPTAPVAPPDGAFAYADSSWTYGGLADLLAGTPVPPGGDGMLFSFLPPDWHEGHWLVAVAPIAWGCSVAFSENAETAGTDLRHLQPTILAGPPRLWKRLAIEFDTASALSSGLQRQMVRLALSGALPGLGGLLRSRMRTRLGLDRAETAALTAGILGARLQQRFTELGIPVASASILGLPAFDPEPYSAGLADLVALPEVFDARVVMVPGQASPKVEVVLDAEAVSAAGGMEEPAAAARSAARNILTAMGLADATLDIHAEPISFLQPSVGPDGSVRWFMLTCARGVAAA